MQLLHNEVYNKDRKFKLIRDLIIYYIYKILISALYSTFIVYYSSFVKL
jgi:hypothetical protein